MSIKAKIFVLAFMIAVVIGILLLNWHPKQPVSNTDKEQSLSNTDKDSSQEHVHILQEKTPGEEQKESPRPNSPSEPAQPENADTSKEKKQGESKQQNSEKELKQQDPSGDSQQSRQKTKAGYTLISVSESYLFSGIVGFFAIINNQKEELCIRLDSVTVELRTDGWDVTTISAPDTINGNFIFYKCKSGIILAPSQEDVEIWQNWLNAEKQRYQEFWAEQKALKAPRRVLPPTD